MEHTVICLSRQFGSGGREIGRRLAECLGIAFYDRELIELAAERGDIQISRLEEADERRTNPWLFKSLYEGNGTVERGASPNDTLFWLQSKVIREIARMEDCLFVGRCAAHVLSRAGISHKSLFICAPWEERVRQVSAREQIDERSAAQLIRRMDKQRRVYTEYYTGGRWGDAESYDLCVSSARLGLEKTVDLLAGYCVQP